MDVSTHCNVGYSRSWKDPSDWITRYDAVS